jgi:hypothetical protein
MSEYRFINTVSKDPNLDLELDEDDDGEFERGQLGVMRFELSE